MTLPQSKIFSDVFSAFYNTLNSHVTDPLSRDSQWIFSSFPEEDISKQKVKYPVIIIEPAKMTWETFTQTKNWNMIEMSFSAYSLQMIQADSLLDQINDAIDHYRNDLKNTYNLSFIKLTGTDTDFTLRGAARAHIRSVTYTMQRAFTTGLAKGIATKTINSNAVIA
jgi:hypothetical protein